MESLGGTLDNHHEPLADARAVVELLNRYAAIQGIRGGLVDIANSVGVRFGRMVAGTYRGSVAILPGSSKFMQPELNPEADPDGYLYGRVVVFTGTLGSMTRSVAWGECARVGATAERSTTKRTNVLVVGDVNPAVLRPGADVTGRARRAFELQDLGQDIEVMTEDDFLRCLDGEPLDAAPGLVNLQQ